MLLCRRTAEIQSKITRIHYQIFLSSTEYLYELYF